tara:strand:+ start:761 stop:2911 length:2151 start_codon:yes stop_codon:yes gene_type:complete
MSQQCRNWPTGFVDWDGGRGGKRFKMSPDADVYIPSTAPLYPPVMGGVGGSEFHDPTYLLQLNRMSAAHNSEFASHMKCLDIIAIKEEENKRLMCEFAKVTKDYQDVNKKLAMEKSKVAGAQSRFKISESALARVIATAEKEDSAWRDKCRTIHNISRKENAVSRQETDLLTSRLKIQREKNDSLCISLKHQESVVGVLNLRHKETMQECHRLQLATRVERQRAINMDALSTEWTGRALRLKWIIDEMVKVGAVRLPDHEWATDMVHDIEFPNATQDGPGPSIMVEVSRSIRDRYLPNYADAHMEDVDEDIENDLIHELSRVAHNLSDRIPSPLMTIMNENPERARELVIMVQSRVRAVMSRIRIHRIWGTSCLQHCGAAVKIQRAYRMRCMQSPTSNHAAIMIQRIYRGFRSRGIRYYPTFYPNRRPVPLGGRPHSAILLAAQDTAISRMSVFRDQVYAATQRPPLAQRWRGIRATTTNNNRVIIRFCNTGEDKYTVQWISPYLTSPDQLDNPANIVCGQLGQPLITYAGHWFWIENITTGVGKAIRINRGSTWTGQQSTISSWIFDLNTGICLDNDKYLGLIQLLLREVKDRIQDTWTDYDEENTRIAIAMSLDLNHVVPQIVGHLTNDVPDYDIESMFIAEENEDRAERVLRVHPCPYDDEFAVIQAVSGRIAAYESNTTTIQHGRHGIGSLPHYSYSSHGITRSTSPEEEGF